MTQTTKKPRILLADDHSLVAAGLRSMLAQTCDVVGSVDNGRALIQAAERLNPDVILLDISMPELNGVDAARRLRKLVPRAKLVFVTMHTDATFVREALRAGGSGYVAKQSAPTELLIAIGEVLRGHTYLTPMVTKGFVNDVLHQAAAGTPGSLTTRQREVLQLVAEGHSNKEIGAALGVSPKTVEFHRTNIMRTLGLTTTADLVKYAVRHGLASG